MKLRKTQRPLYTVEIIDVPRRHWWEHRKVRLRCTCGWTSPQTWPARPSTESAYSDHRIRLAFAAIHLNR